MEDALPSSTRRGLLALLQALTRENVLLAVFGLYLAASLSLLVFLRASQERALEKGILQGARATAIAMMQGAPSLDIVARTDIWAHWLRPEESVDEFDERARRLLNAPTQRFVYRLHLYESPAHVHLVWKCIDDVAATLAPQATAKQIELIVNIHAGVPERILGDPNRVRQILRIRWATAAAPP